jgi:hypothetical protein
VTTDAQFRFSFRTGDPVLANQLRQISAIGWQKRWRPTATGFLCHEFSFSVPIFNGNIRKSIRM